MLSWGFELGVLVIDSAVIIISYFAYSGCKERFQRLKNAPEFTADDSLLQNLKNNIIDLVAINGNIIASEPPLQSLYNNKIEGVIRNIVRKEHKTQKIQGYWSDNTSILQDSTEFCQFGLGNNNKIHVIVHDAYRADLEGVLHKTYDNFVAPPNSGLFDKMVSRFFGEVSKGFHETESMLPINSNVLVVGKLLLNNNKWTFTPPDNFPYIITRSSKEQLLQEYNNWKSISKVFMIGGIFIASFCAISILKKVYNNWTVKKQADFLRKQALDIRRQREAITTPVANPDETCTVCLTNPRDLVVLECGHVCICVDCYEALRLPKLCPVCRGFINRVVLVYNP